MLSPIRKISFRIAFKLSDAESKTQPQVNSLHFHCAYHVTDACVWVCVWEEGVLGVAVKREAFTKELLWHPYLAHSKTLFT